MQSSTLIPGRGSRVVLVLLVCLASVGASVPRPQATAAVRPEWRAALEEIRADSLRGHLSFLASDALEGRRTPSRGLDLAAEYIAAQFRRAGLEAAGDDGYFQTANWKMTGREAAGVELKLAGGPSALTIGVEQLSLGFSIMGVSLWPLADDLALSDAGTVKVAYGGGASAFDALKPEQVAGKVVLTEFPALPRGDRAAALKLLQEENDFAARAHALGSPLVVSFDRASARGRGVGSPRLTDPDSPGGRTSPFGNTPTAPVVFAHGAEAARLFDALPAGPTPAALTFRAPPRVETPVRVRNVAGILRGSDPVLKDTYVIVSAHYDHIGVREGCASGSDCVNNGANDDGSGTVGVVEMASALARLNPRPKRSILFLTFFGEELGLVGSRFYGRRPVVPLEKTVAQLNMEQVGRTDDSDEGPQLKRATLTGFDFSEVGAVMRAAGESVGVEIYKHPKNSDAFFGRSDNQALADVGVPAHTVGVTFMFPDYHAVGDHWDKIDYANMERVVRAVALGALSLADNPQAPRWDESNPKTAKYVEAWKKLHGK